MLPFGHYAWIEVKLPKTGRLSPDQKWFIEKINSEGGCAFVARSTDDLDEKLGAFYGKGHLDLDLDS